MPYSTDVCFQCHNRLNIPYCSKCALATAPTGPHYRPNCNSWNKPYPGDRKMKASGKQMILEEDRKEEDKQDK
jgi:hypothetical protein